jgi:peptide/nickel transport system substrate-binding protein
MKRLQGKWTLGLGLLAFSLFFLAPTDAPVAAGKSVLNIGVGVDVVTLDPHNYKATTDLLVDNLIFETLVKFDLKMNVVPGLASSWDMINDTTWRFRLRKGVKFQDGTPLNAEAVRFNLMRMKDAPRGKGYYGMIKSATVEDEYTVVVTTHGPFAPFLKNMSVDVGGIMSPESIKKYGDNIIANPVGTGSFRLKEWRPREKLILINHEGYWGKKSKLDEIVFLPIPEEGTRAMAFESGEIDVISDPLPHRIETYKKNKNISIITGPATRTVWLGFNVGDKTLSNLKLRQAIAHAVNRDEIVNNVVEGLAINAQAWIPSVVEKSKKDYNFKYDLKRAKELLKEAGYPNGLELNLWTPEGRYLKDRQIAEAVQAQLAQIGIKTNIRVMEWGAYLDACARHEQQLYIIGWGFSAGDPDTALRLCFYSDNQFNYSNYKSPAMDKLLDDAVAMLDPKKRSNLYEQVQQKLIDETIVVPIYHKLNIYAVNKRVVNFNPHPMERIEIGDTSIK